MVGARRRRGAVILPDVNVLVFAHRREAAGHERYAAWLGDLVAGSDELAVVESTLVGFVRVVTNPRIMADPTPTEAALRFVGILRGASRSRWLGPTQATWRELRRIADADSQVRGNLVPDAWLAALCRSHGARLASADRGFARFEGLDCFDPVA